VSLITLKAWEVKMAQCKLKDLMENEKENATFH
jgi:hypothetical protein